MLVQCCSGFLCSDVEVTLSFTRDTVPLLWLTVKDLSEVCHLSMWGKARTPISHITQEPLLSLTSFTRWIVVHSLRSAYSDFHQRIHRAYAVPSV